MVKLRPLPDHAPRWAHQARQCLRAGYSWAKAGEAVGKTDAGVRYWLEPGFRERVYARHKEWRQRNPERDRASARAWKHRNKERVRAVDNAYRADPARRGRCRECGGLMGIGCFKDGICQPCRTDIAEQRRWALIKMWNGGATIREMAAALDTTLNTMGVWMARLRADGYPLPHRYNISNGKRLPADKSATVSGIASDQGE